MKAADGGQGVACLYGNYAGDNMNVKMAIKMAERAGIPVKTVVANDDVPSAPKGEEAKRRGVAGEILMWKTASACAAQGGTLDEVIAVAQKTIERTRSIGIGPDLLHHARRSARPTSTSPTARWKSVSGHHGEPGIHVTDIVPADAMAKVMVDTLLPDLPFNPGDRVAVLISGLGATPVMEQYILYASVAKYLGEAGLTVAVPLVGNFFTSLEMMGVTLSVLQLDEELEAYMKQPCSSIGITRTGA